MITPAQFRDRMREIAEVHGPTTTAEEEIAALMREVLMGLGYGAGFASYRASIDAQYEAMTRPSPEQAAAPT